MTHTFDTDHAKAFGIEAAVILWAIDYWIRKNKANKENFKEGRYWTYNTVTSWHELFPYMTRDVIRRRLDRLVDSGVLLKGFFNTDPRDRTSWYSIDLDRLQLATQTIESGQRNKCSIKNITSTTITSEPTSSGSNEQLGIELPEQTAHKKASQETDISKIAYPLLVTVWCEADKARKFSGVDGKKIKSIISKILHYFKNKGQVPTAQAVADFFEFVVKNPQLPGFLKGAQLTTIDGQWDKAIFEILNGKKPSFNSQNSASRAFGAGSEM